MAFDGIIITKMADELSDLLVGGKIEKIYQPETDELLFHVHSKSNSYKLYASASGGHARFHLLSKAPENPQTPFALCMLLRKHLIGGRITSISQIDSERILEIDISTINELGFSVSKTLVFEVMGKHSNIILLDAASRKIIDSIKRVTLDESRVRQILPGREYSYPPSQGKISFKSITQDELAALCDCPAHALSKNLLN
jgi:predicted ribosome quality control (RQC) complex YloA/Tae2 family protein